MTLFRLIALMLCGALGGAVFIGSFLLEHYHLYDHGFGEGARCGLSGAVIGAMLGVGVDGFWRLTRLPSLRFSTKDLLVAMTMIAISLAIVVALVAWAASTPRYPY